MNRIKLFTAIATTAAMVAAPAWALPSQVPANHGSSGHNPHAQSTPGPNASLPAKANAYGFYCQKESKKHIAGQHGTPFSQCVTALAKLATGATTNPAAACAKESKKHVAGQHGTPFSQCVSAAAKLKASEHS
jgi:hypothetical protein